MIKYSYKNVLKHSVFMAKNELKYVKEIKIYGKILMLNLFVRSLIKLIVYNLLWGLSLLLMAEKTKLNFN